MSTTYWDAVSGSGRIISAKNSPFNSLESPGWANRRDAPGRAASSQKAAAGLPQPTVADDAKRLPLPLTSVTRRTPLFPRTPEEQENASMLEKADSIFATMSLANDNNSAIAYSSTLARERVTDSILTDPKTINVKVKAINLCDARWLTAPALKEIGIKCPNLVICNLSGCVGLRDDAMAEIGRNCSKLELLNVKGCVHLSDKSLVALSGEIGQSYVAYAQRMQARLRLIRREEEAAMEAQAAKDAAADPRFAKPAAPAAPAGGGDTKRGGKGGEEKKKSDDLKVLTIDEWLEVHNADDIMGKGLECLHRLEMSHCQLITDVGLQALSLSCNAISMLDLSYCPALQDPGLIRLISGLPLLTSANLAGLKRISNAVPACLAASCPLLSMVSFKLCNQIAMDDDGISKMAIGCRQLQHVDLEGCNQLTDKAVIALATRCPKITTLLLGGCTGVGDEALRSIGSGLQEIRQLNVCKIKCVSWLPVSAPVLISTTLVVLLFNFYSFPMCVGTWCWT